MRKLNEANVSYPKSMNGKNKTEEKFIAPSPPYLISGVRSLLCAIMLQAMRDAQKQGTIIGDEAREFLRNGAGWIMHYLYGLELNGEELLALIDGGHIDKHLRMKVMRYSRDVHRMDRPDLEEIRLKPLPPELNENLLTGGEKL